MKDFSQLGAVDKPFDRGSCLRKLRASIQIPNVQACRTIMPTELFPGLKNYTIRRTPRHQEEPIRITTGEILGMLASVLSTATHVVSIPVHDTSEQRHREVSQLNIGCSEPLWQHANQCTPGFQSVTSRTIEKGATLAQHTEVHRNRANESVSWKDSLHLYPTSLVIRAVWREWKCTLGAAVEKKTIYTWAQFSRRPV